MRSKTESGIIIPVKKPLPAPIAFALSETTGRVGPDSADQGVSCKVVRKVIRSSATEFRYERESSAP